MYTKLRPESKFNGSSVGKKVVNPFGFDVPLAQV